ncbi:hypothetical protein VOLCADRAFT_91911 [Volvox carteri f. nagariensis]|uniref:Uncharacterized protein n=1 Tax=Volvox carteri f. nagariensis TaxID=3068 RepID=D8TYA1_VOLCA|nr:uncharacterized protein VOLCADRAFT_91911 [Volvox carteri f. nagariensis]EFJ47514.1 hypothetical protein VOLCADRAFT_91911 [Volvox carteri f. nagariensis]|eukprot:XP_002951338.1 hypothetical protein VOLCADRAFT_91911 [Volvox carteri f. nagariensis]
MITGHPLLRQILFLALRPKTLQIVFFLSLLPLRLLLSCLQFLLLRKLLFLSNPVIAMSTAGGDLGPMAAAGQQPPANVVDLPMVDQASDASSPRLPVLKEPPPVGVFDVTAEAASKAQMALGAYINFVVMLFRSAFLMCGWKVSDPHSLAWINFHLGPPQLLGHLHSCVAALTPPVIPSLEWLESWLVANVSSTTDNPDYVAAGNILAMTSKHFPGLNDLLNFVLEQRRVLTTHISDHMWILFIFHMLPDRLRSILQLRTDGNKLVEWSNLDEFMTTCRCNAKLYRPLVSAANAGASGSTPNARTTPRSFRSPKSPAMPTKSSAPRKTPIPPPAISRLPDNVPNNRRFVDYEPGRKLYIKGLTAASSRQLKAQKKCLLCKSKQHMVPTCELRATVLDNMFGCTRHLISLKIFCVITCSAKLKRRTLPQMPCLLPFLWVMVDLLL